MSFMWRARVPPKISSTFMRPDRGILCECIATVFMRERRVTRSDKVQVLLGYIPVESTTRVDGVQLEF